MPVTYVTIQGVSVVENIFKKMVIKCCEVNGKESLTFFNLHIWLYIVII